MYDQRLTSDYYNNIMIADKLTTDYQQGFGFGTGTNSWYPYGKKSSDGRTFYWYHVTNEGSQYNSNNYVYRYIAFA